MSITALVTGGYALWSTHGFACDGTDPVKSRCANTQVYLDSRGVSTAAGEPLGPRTSSPRCCGTKWLEVDIKAADGLVMKSIARDHIKEWLPFTLPNKYVELDSDHGDGVSRSQQTGLPGRRVCGPRWTYSTKREGSSPRPGPGPTAAETPRLSTALPASVDNCLPLLVRPIRATPECPFPPARRTQTGSESLPALRAGPQTGSECPTKGGGGRGGQSRAAAT